MNDPDRQRFAFAMEALAEAFQREMREATLHGYWLGLCDLPIESVEQATMRAIRKCQHMPRPAELRELAGDMTSEARGVIAWDSVQRAIGSRGSYASVCFDDPVVNATIRNLGGWQKLCATLTDEMKWVRKDFERVYDALLSSGISEEAGAYLVGVTEQANLASGHPAPPAVLVATGLPPHREGVVRGRLSGSASSLVTKALAS